MQKYLYYDIKIDLEINLKSSYDMATQATRRDGSIAPTHSQPGTRRKWVVGFSRFTHVKETVRFVQKASGTRGAGLDGTETLTPGPSRPRRVAVPTAL
jgi:hypothetical protein